MNLVKISIEKVMISGIYFLYKDEKPVISELSYVFPAYIIHGSAGYWDQNLNWFKGHIWPQDAIIEDVVNFLQVNM